MPISVGGSEITDIQIGSTAINSVWIGATQVWSRAPAYSLVVTGTGFDLKIDPANALAFRYFSVSPDPAPTGIVWSYVINAGPTNGGVVGAIVSSANSYQVYLQQNNIDTSTATITTTATIGGTVVISETRTYTATVEP